MLDPQYVAEFQFAGQDIPWLLAHWAKHKPQHPFLVWEPKSGEPKSGEPTSGAQKRWTYEEFDRETSSLAAGLAGKGVVKGDKILIHADNCPEMVLAWYACAKLGAVGVTTNTRSAGPEVDYFAAEDRKYKLRFRTHLR